MQKKSLIFLKIFGSKFLGERRVKSQVSTRTYGTKLKLGSAMIGYSEYDRL